MQRIYLSSSSSCTWWLVLFCYQFSCHFLCNYVLIMTLNYWWCNGFFAFYYLKWSKFKVAKEHVNVCLIKFNDELIRGFEYRISSAEITALNRLNYKYFTNELFGLIGWVTRQVNYVQLVGLENVLDSSFVNVPSSTWIFVCPVSITNLVSFGERSIIINELYRN